MTDAHEQAQQQRLRFAGMMDGLPLMFGAARGDGFVEYTNAGWHAFVGTPAAGEPGHAPLGHGWLGYFHPDDVADARAAFERARHTCEAFDFRWRLRAADGCWRWCLGRVTPECDAEGRVQRWLWALWDVDQQMRAQMRVERAERDLRRERMRLALVFEAADIGLWDWEPDTGRSSWNAQIYDMIGLPRGGGVESFDLLLRHVLEADRARLQDAFARSCEAGSTFDAEFRVVRPDGALRWCVSRGQAIKNARGGLERMMGVMLDMTESKEAQRTLEQANTQKDEFLAMLGHELRNPIAPVANAIAILRRAGDDPARRQAVLDMMQRQLGHFTRLVDDLLEASRVRQGRIALRREPVPICDAIHAAVEAVRPQIESRGHALSLALPPARPVVLADPTRMAQVVTNLLNNAAKYTPPGGRIDVTVEDRGDWVELRVADNGAGIHPELLPQVFDLFTQAQRTLDRAEGGLGIGLALVKRLVELHGGTVSAHSDGPGRGACFMVRLPVMADAPVPPAGQVAQVAQLASSAALRAAADGEGPAAGLLGEPPAPMVRAQPGRRLLLVGAAPHWGESVVPLLWLDGHEARLVEGEAALVDAAREQPPEAVLLDIGAATGFDADALARLRAHDGLRRAQWFAVSSRHGRADDRRRALDWGFRDLIALPVSYERLTEALARLDTPTALPGSA